MNDFRFEKKLIWDDVLQRLVDNKSIKTYLKG